MISWATVFQTLGLQRSCSELFHALNSVIHGGRAAAEHQHPPHEEVLVPLGGAGVAVGVVGGINFCFPEYRNRFSEIFIINLLRLLDGKWEIDFRVELITYVFINVWPGQFRMGKAVL